MTQAKSTRTLNKAVKAVKPIVKKLYLPTSEPFRHVLVYTTSKGLVFIIPQGMDGISFRRWRDAHKDEIDNWIKTL
jgi:hypothetical protein